MAVGDQLSDNRIDTPFGVQCRFQGVDIKADVEGLQVEVLFAAQPGNGKVADVLQIFGVTGGGRVLVAGLYGLTGQVGTGHILDILALIATFRPARVIRFDSQAAQLNRKGQVADLDTGIVVIKFAGHIPAGGIKHPAERIADGRPATVADMQRSGRIGADKLHLHLFPVAAGSTAIVVVLCLDLQAGWLARRLATQKS